MSAAEQHEPFDFRRLLIGKGGPTVRARIFEPIRGPALDPNHAKHQRIARHWLSNHVLPGSTQPWDLAVRACAEPGQKPGMNIITAVGRYEDDFDAMVAAVVSSFEQLVASEKEVLIERKYLANMWAQLNDRVQFFRDSYPDLGRARGIPDRETFASALDHVLSEISEHMECPEITMPSARQATRQGEYTREALAEGKTPAEAAASAQQRMEVRERKLSHDMAFAVRLAMMNVPEPISGKGWFEAFSRASTEQANTLRAAAVGSDSEALTQLYQSWRQLENSLIIYAELVRHNLRHLDDQQSTDLSFDRLCDDVARLQELLPTQRSTLPDLAQFRELRPAIEAAARTAAQQESPSHTARMNDKRGGSAKDSRGPGYPGGHR